MYSYSAFGLHVLSSLPIIEFPPCADQGGDITVIFHPPEQPGDFIRDKSWHFDVNRENAFLYFSNVAVFHLHAGSSISVIPVPGGDTRLVQLYLIGSVFSVLLYQRGCLVFHASSVAINSQDAILFVGDSGAGKSSLAAALHCRGYRCLSDDVCAIKVNDDLFSITPTYPFIKIDQELAARLHIAEELLKPIHKSEPKKYFHLGANFPNTPHRVKAVFVLERAGSTGISPLRPQQFMLETVRHTIPTRLLQRTGDPLHFQQCSMVAKTVPAYQLKRKEHEDSLEDLLQIVLACVGT